MYRPNPTSAIGNLSLSLATHTITCIQKGLKPTFHRDVLAYGRDKLLVIPNIEEGDVPEDNGFARIYGFIHLHHPNISRVMNKLIKPTSLLSDYISQFRPIVKGCLAGFHIRRGTLCEDSTRFGFLPFASDKAVEAMIQKALEIKGPVYVLSDSVSTKELFKSRVPQAITLDLTIGFTADEHSQMVEVPDEDVKNKMNSFVEWFLLSEMPVVYMTAGGINGRNVIGTVTEGITSTFGYSAALYGGKIPWYVFNDGYITCPNGSEKDNSRYCWSDMIK